MWNETKGRLKKKVALPIQSNTNMSYLHSVESASIPMRGGTSIPIISPIPIIKLDSFTVKPVDTKKTFMNGNIAPQEKQREKQDNFERHIRLSIFCRTQVIDDMFFILSMNKSIFFRYI